jgi:preprotein translocase subunit Sss1
LPDMIEHYLSKIEATRRPIHRTRKPPIKEFPTNS